MNIFDSTYSVRSEPGFTFGCRHENLTTTLRRVSVDGQRTYDVHCPDCDHKQVRLTYKRKR